MVIIALVCYYYFADPFKVIHQCNDYSYPKTIPNRDFISTQSYLDKHVANKYNSFIFGSSRTLGFRVNSWKRYLDSSANPFVFDASSESLAGIHQKIKYLDSMNVDIRNVLILLCRDCSFLNTINETRHLIIKHPEISRKSNWRFQLSFLSAYFDNKFLARYLVYKITGKYKPWMRGYIEYRDIKYDSVNNELTIVDQENEIIKDENLYYEKRQNIFYDRKAERIDSVAIIDEVNRNYLVEIKNILEKRKANYKIILSPLYEQKKFNPADKKLLSSVFGQRLYDFTGKNKFTDNCRNFYEASHFRPLVGDSLLALVYR